MMSRLRCAVCWIRERIQNVRDRLIEDLIVFGLGLAIGAGTVWFFGPGPSTSTSPAGLPPGYDSYIILAQNFADAEREMKSKTELIFDPVGLRKLRLCGDTLDIANRPRGQEYLNLIIQRLDGCLNVDKEPNIQPTKITLSPNPSNPRYKQTFRALGPNLGTEKLFFCGCEEETIGLLERNVIFP